MITYMYVHLYIFVAAILTRNVRSSLWSATLTKLQKKTRLGPTDISDISAAVLISLLLCMLSWQRDSHFTATLYLHPLVKGQTRAVH